MKLKVNLKLVGFSQDVDLSDPDKVRYWLNLVDDHNKMMRLPVQQETTTTLIHMLYGGDQAVDNKAELEKQAAKEEDLELEERPVEDPNVGQSFQMPSTGDPDLDGPDLLSVVPSRDEVQEYEESEPQEEPDDFDSEESVPSL